jgi:hypothetical protein
MTDCACVAGVGAEAMCTIVMTLMNTMLNLLDGGVPVNGELRTTLFLSVRKRYLTLTKSPEIWESAGILCQIRVARFTTSMMLQQKE